MLNTYTFPRFAYRPSEEQRSGALRRHPVVVVGAGPVGLTAALDCAQRGLSVVLLDDNDTVSVGSRAVCYAKRALEVWHRLGVAQPMVDKGVRWQIGKVFFRDDEVFRFDLLPEAGHEQPAMINLQQYHLEQMLVDACQRESRIDLRWKHKLISVQPHDDHVSLTVETPDGVFTLEADWLIACDGANSDTRRMLGAEFTGQFFQDRFLIADVVLERELFAEGKVERWFWFDPPFHRGQSVLLHKQCDRVWRIDFQLGWQADPEEAKKPENVIPRIRAMLGEDVPFELEWVSVYQFACRRIDDFRRGRVLFAGDSAHQVSPFGARGANSGVQDVDNLAWKLALVVQGKAPESLLDSYHAERAAAADDNLRNSTRSTDFITPKSRASLRLRNAVLELAKTETFARPLVNSGRLSMPTPYPDSPLVTPADAAFDGPMAPGSPCADAPVRWQGRDAWWLDVLSQVGGFVLLCFGERPRRESLEVAGVRARVLHVGSDVDDAQGLLARRYGGAPGTTLLIRPDQFVAARLPRFDAAAIERAMARSLGH